MDELKEYKTPSFEEILDAVAKGNMTVSVQVRIGKEEQGRATDNIKVRIERHTDFIQFDVVPAHEDNALPLAFIWQSLEKYGAAYEEEMKNGGPNLNNNELPAEFSLVIIPDDFQSRICIVAVAPSVWALTAAALNRPADIVRILFQPENINIIESTFDEEAEMTDYRDELLRQRDLAALDYNEEEQKRAEVNEYYDRYAFHQQ